MTKLLHSRFTLAAAFSMMASVAFAQSCDPKVAAGELIKPGTLVMSTNPTLPPLQFVDSSGQLKGMRVELGEEIAKRLCLKPEYVRIEFSAMVPGLQAGRWDMINTGIFFTEERAKVMQMIPYEDQAISISIAPNSDKSVKSKDDLAGMTIGVEIGGFEETKTRLLDKELRDAGKAGLSIRTFDNFALAFQALRAGQVDGVVSIDAVAKEYDARGDFKRAISGLYPAPVAVAFKSPALADAVSATLKGMKADGSLKTLFDKYGLPMVAGDYSVKGPGR
ncbi:MULTISPECIES: ABC transporter substrate-binding protein [Agrobacterium]|uniref:Polar amino acid transport system substrate-binding protein n=1 Tax=Agrobacterium larrymoorei TaxID=160699 RepID=A0AAJ2BF50_9HYPH|nr:ABC transporter substrate-binding protein [Agrobacterium larrymoorei]MDQ1196182.1 polar amino acid transport system substrate-binding protein [Rhizobium sp. SORGH_AS_0787]MDR6101704.1 polar amino acid transport system substrate-binding protein [Agrobacterium larrymoorei]